MVHDKEIEAMLALAKSLEPLDEDVKGRVLRWAFERYSVPLPLKNKVRSVVSDIDQEREESPSGLGESSYESAAELLANSGAVTEAEKSLVVAYWFQVVQNQSDLESQTLNTELKHLGHGIGNITRALDSLMKQRPQLLIQLRKAGTSKQARKKYKLTSEGIRKVRQMLAGQPNDVVPD